MSKLTVGAQLYTVRDYMKNEADLAVCLKKVAKIGYRTVQMSGMSGVEPERVRELCDQNDLKIVLTHNNPDDLRFNTEKIIRVNEIYGCDYIGLGAMPPRYRTEEWIGQFIEDFREPAKKIAAAGKHFMYHNHSFDFRKTSEKRLIEYLPPTSWASHWILIGFRWQAVICLSGPKNCRTASPVFI